MQLLFRKPQPLSSSLYSVKSLSRITSEKAIARGISIVDTGRPCKLDDMDPNDLLKEGIVVIQSMAPVCSLYLVVDKDLMLPTSTYPNKQLPTDTTMEATPYADDF